MNCFRLEIHCRMSFSSSLSVSLDSRYSPSHRNNKNNNNNNDNNNNDNSNKNRFFIYVQTGTYGFSYQNLRHKLARLGVHSELWLRCSPRSEASHPRQLETLIALVKFVEGEMRNSLK